MESLDLEANASVGLSIAQGRLIVDPRPVPRYYAGRIGSECESRLPDRGGRRVAWRPSMGREAIEWIAGISTMSTSTRFGGMNRPAPGMFW